MPKGFDTAESVCAIDYSRNDLATTAIIVTLGILLISSLLSENVYVHKFLQTVL